MRSMLIIGVGRFGKHLALKFMELGNQVMVVDRDEETITKIAPLVTRAQIGDCMELGVLKSLGVANFDICFVCISDDFQSSLEITSNLRELGAKRIIAKADRDIHAKFLLRIGADEIVYPERDMAQRAAVRYSAREVYDYIELTPEYAIMELSIPNYWVGKTVVEVNVRSRYNVNIIGVKEGEKVVPLISASYVFRENEHILAAGSKKDIIHLMDRA